MSQAQDGDGAPRALDNFLTTYLPGFILALGTGIALPALPVFAKSFEISFGVASLIVVMNLAGSAFAAIPTGYLADRFGRRKLIIAGPVFTAITSVLVATSGSFPELLFWRFLGGMAAQMWTLARLASITDTGGQNRGSQITTLFGFDAAGRLLGPALGGFVAGAFDVRVPFVLHGILALLAVLPSIKLARDTRPAPAPSGAGVGAHGTARPQSTMRDLLVPMVLVLLSVQFLVALTRGTLWGGTLNLYAVYAYDIGPEALGILVAVAGAVGLPITISAGHFMDRFGRKALVVPGLTLIGAAMIFLAVTAWLHLPFGAFVGALLALSFATSLTSGSMQTLASDVAPPHARGRFFGIWRTVGETGLFLSPAIFAVLAEQFGYSAGFAYNGATGLAAAFLLAALVPETFRPEPKAPAAAADAQVSTTPSAETRSSRPTIR
jgi:MFS family permease